MRKVTMWAVGICLLPLVMVVTGCQVSEEAVTTEEEETVVEQEGEVTTRGAGLQKPTVGYVPQGWSVLSDHIYTTCLGYDEGVLIYGDGELQSPNSVEIHYRDMYEESSAVGGQPVTDVDRIIAEWAIYNLKYDSIEPEESGTMIVGGQIAGYAKGYDPVGDNYVLVLQCFNEPICLSLRALWEPTFEEEDVKRLIESISF